MKNLVVVTLLFSTIVSLVGCNKDDGGGETSKIEARKLSGYIQKGPFLNGTTVNLSELDGDLNQTGLTFSSRVTDNSGNFVFDGLKTSSSVVLLNANGFYYNEVIGENSSATLALTAMADIENKNRINVNLLTHLQKNRIEVLVDKGIDLQRAVDSTQSELLKNFGVTKAGISESDQLNMFVDSEDNAILIALSIIIQGNKTVSDFSEFLANINLDFSDDGQIQEEVLKAELYRSAQNLNLGAIRNHLKERYEALGFTSEVPNFERIVTDFLALKAPFEIEFETQDVSCNGVSDGTIDLTITGGTNPFSFEWSNGKESEDLDSLPAGTFSVFVTDNNGNRLKVDSITIAGPDGLMASSEVINSGINEGNGSIDLTVNGGTEPYSFEWSNNQVTEDIENLVKGTYSVIITDINGCSLNQDIDVQEEIELTLEVTATPCFSESTGALDLTVNGGLAPYSFEWSNGSDSEDIENIQAGTYTVTVTDQLGYTVTSEIELGQNPEISVDYQIVRPTPGLGDGSINLSVEGGIPPYQYEWFDSSTDSQLNNIPSGEYSVTVTDSNSCSIVLSIPVYGEFTDNRDGNRYKTIQLGSQVWFAENLRSELDNQGNSISYFCISNSEANCDSLGHMYTFEISQSVCPQGWKMPTDSDWQQLEQYLGMPQSEIDVEHGVRGEGVGIRLKEGGDSLFEAKLTGTILFPFMDSGSTISENETTIFWSNTVINGTNAPFRALDYDHGGIYRSDLDIEHFATCIRCIKE